MSTKQELHEQKIAHNKELDKHWTALHHLIIRCIENETDRKTFWYYMEQIQIGNDIDNAINRQIEVESLLGSLKSLIKFIEDNHVTSNQA